MIFKLLVIIAISSIFIFHGLAWYRKGLSSKEPYDFKEDFKASFFTPYWSNATHLKMNDGKPRKIFPIMYILGGIGILIVGLFKILSYT